MNTFAHQIEADQTNQADEAADSGAALIHAEAAEVLPTSFGAFKPVGHVMVGLPTQAQLGALVAVLREGGWLGATLRQFSPLESAAELQAMVDKAGVLSVFGYEIKALRRYASLTEAGYRWLLVQVDDLAHAETAANAARDCGATMAMYYRTLTLEELIPEPAS
jgi:hypothetical protein